MPFDKQPSLSGNLVSVRPLNSDDFPALFAVAADPLLWEQHPASDRYREDVFKDFFVEALASGGALLVSDNESGEVIGSSRFHSYSEKDRSVEIGWTFLARRCWGGTYNKELKALMLDHAFASVEKVVFLIGPENFRSQEATKKLGAKQIQSRTTDKLGANLVFELERKSYEEKL